jgi:hypothetical protein
MSSIRIVKTWIGSKPRQLPRLDQIDQRVPSLFVEHGQIAGLTDPYLAGLSDDLDFRARGARWA